jgi:hypothetical protein
MFSGNPKATRPVGAAQARAGLRLAATRARCALGAKSRCLVEVA